MTALVRGCSRSDCCLMPPVAGECAVRDVLLADARTVMAVEKALGQLPPSVLHGDHWGTFSWLADEIEAAWSEVLGHVEPRPEVIYLATAPSGALKWSAQYQLFSNAELEGGGIDPSGYYRLAVGPGLAVLSTQRSRFPTGRLRWSSWIIPVSAVRAGVLREMADVNEDLQQGTAHG